MFDKGKDRYLTRGVDEKIPLDLQIFMWKLIDKLPEERDYLQVFNLTAQDDKQLIKHSSEQPKHEKEYIVDALIKTVTAKVYVIDDGDHCTMLLAEEY